MFDKITHDGKFLGHLLRLPDGFAFFGSRFLLKEDLPRYFPNLEFRFLKQVHGKRIVEASSQLQEADGHWSKRENEALVIQTADCIPMMIHSPERIIAVHAGWRGVEQKIFHEALAPIVDQSEVTVACGPCISTPSFEVGEDVALRLLSSDPYQDESVIHPHNEPTKRRVNLRRIVENQGKALSSKLNLSFLEIDTFSSPDHHSYRRNGPGAGRLFSFIVRTKAFQILGN